MGTGLADLLQNDPSQPQGFSDLLQTPPPGTMTAEQRQANTTANIQQAITHLTLLRQQSTDPVHQLQLDKLITSMKGQLERGGELKQGPLDNLARGIVAGVAEGPSQVGELAASIPAAFGSDIGSGVRQKLAENIAQVHAALHPQGFAGEAGEFVGQTPAQMLAFGPVGEMAGSVTSKLVPGLAPLLTEKITGGLAKRVAGSAIRGAIEVSPITAISSAASLHDARKALDQSLAQGQITQDQYDAAQKFQSVNAIKQFIVSTAGAAAFSGAVGALSGKAETTTGAEAPQADAAKAAAPASREEELAAINAKAAAAKAAKEADKQNRKMARAEWQLANPTKDWNNDLSKTERKSLIVDYAQRHSAPPPTPTTSAGTEAPPEAPPASEPPSTGTDPYKGMPPAVAAVKKKMYLQKAFKAAGIPYDENKTADELAQQLQAHVDQTSNVPDKLIALGRSLVYNKGQESINAYRSIAKKWYEATGGGPEEFDRKVLEGMTPPPATPAESMPAVPAASENKVIGAEEAGKAAVTQAQQKQPNSDTIAKNAVASIVAQMDVSAAPEKADAIEAGKYDWKQAMKDEGVLTSPEILKDYAEMPAGDLKAQWEAEKAAEAKDPNADHTQHHLALIDAVARQRGIELEPPGPYADIKPGTPEAEAAVKKEKAANRKAVDEAKFKKAFPEAGAGAQEPGSQVPPAGPAGIREGAGEAGAVPTRTGDLSSKTSAQLDLLKSQAADRLASGDTSAKADLTAIQAELKSRTVEPRPYLHLTPDELLSNKEAIQQTIKEGGPNAEEARIRLADIQAEINTRKVEARQSRTDFRTKAPNKVVQEKEAPAIPSSEFRKAPSRLGDKDIAAQIADINRRLASLDPRDSERWQARLAKLLDEQAKRSTKPEGPDGMTPPKGGITLHAHPAVTAFAGGTIYGLYKGDPNKDDYLSRAFMYGLGAAGLVMGAKYLIARRAAMEEATKGSLFPDSKTKIVSADDRKIKTPTTTLLRRFYAGTTRATNALDQLVSETGGLNLPTQKNPAKLAAFIGRYAAQTESWLGVRPSIVGDDGQVHWLQGASLDDILHMAKGNKADLDKLAVAYTSAELAGTLGESKVPMGQMEREYIIRSAPQYLVDAVKALREYHLNLLRTQLDAGLITQEGFDKMASEQFYAPLQRAIERVETLKSGKKNFAGQPTAIEARVGGGKLMVKSPYDISVGMTAKMLRAAEYGKFINALMDHLETLPSFVRNEIIQPVNIAAKGGAQDFEAAAAELRKALNISQADARAMLAYTSTGEIQGNPGVIRVVRNGVAGNYRVRQDVFNAIKSLSPAELDDFWRVVGYPTRLATKGVVINPMFTFRRGVIETFLGYLGSEYGFRPVLDQVPAWWNAFTRSDKYREMQAAGGFGSVQSIQYRKLVGIRGGNAASEAWNLLGHGHVLDAWRTLMEPIIETARVAEYLAAKRNGASTLEAAYAANNLLGNVRMQGNFGGMRIFNYLSMFARPTISHVDRLLEKSGLHPYRVPEYNKTAVGQAFQEAGVNPRIAAALTFMTKGFVSITLPSMYLWHLYQNDSEINDLRKTSVGAHYWFFRNPSVEKGQDGSIIRIPKPQVIGQIFGTSMEGALDKHYNQDPTGTMRALEGIYDEAALNVVPQIGVIPLSLWANQDLRYGTPIVPGSSVGADPYLQGYDNASIPSRLIAQAASPFSKDLTNETMRRALSPAGIDYVVNTFAGMFGQDALRAVNDALLYKQQGYLPAKEELPLVSRLLARYPSMQTNTAQTFYDNSAKVQAASETVNKLIAEDPSKLGDYYAQNMDRIQLIKVYGEVRQQVANYRRALEDLRQSPPGSLSKEARQKYEKTFIQMMLNQMEVANKVAKQAGLN